MAPGEVDTNLEDEVGTECTVKYGAVRGVMIFEVTQPGFPPELAVRIFVAFERQEDATKVRVYDLEHREDPASLDPRIKDGSNPGLRRSESYDRIMRPVRGEEVVNTVGREFHKP